MSLEPDIRGVLFDLDGVLYIGEEPVPGAAEAVRWAREQPIPHLFVTNTTSRPRSALAAKLEKMGLAASEEQFLTPAAAAAEWLRRQPEGPLALFLRPAARSEFEGFPRVSDDAERGARYVILGDLGGRWDYPTLNRAFRLLHHEPAARLIALGMTRYWEAPSGVSLDVAPFIAALEHATGKKAVVLGKPAKAFFDAAVAKLGLPANEVLMIGDDARTDVAAAQAAGLRGALVRTGKFREPDLDSVQPDAVLDSVASLPEWWGERH